MELATALEELRKAKAMIEIVTRDRNRRAEMYDVSNIENTRLQRALDAEREKVAKLEAALDAAQGESTRWFRAARLQREAGRDLRALVRAYREAKVAFDDGRLREDHHAWKERFSKLELTEAALIDYTMRTMDATTPASGQE